jgi:hypothetical protein
MTSRARNLLLWGLAFVITLGAAFYQRVTGPTHPVRGAVTFDVRVPFELQRSHAGPAECLISVRVPDEKFRGQINYRDHKSGGAWNRISMRLENGELIGALPHQEPGGMFDYQVFLTRQQHVSESGAPAIQANTLPLHAPLTIRFRDSVPAFAMIPHILLMFLGMLVSNRAGIEALRRDGVTRRLADWAFWLMIGGGLIFGPLVLWYSFRLLWTGVPIGLDITDNKTLIAIIAWLIAVIAERRSKRAARRWSLAASIVTLVVFSIPHSVS